MKKPIDRFSGKNADEIYEKENLLDENNLEKDDKLAMFLAAMKVFLPGLLLVVGPLLMLTIFL
ncbi:hypothetical protein [Anaerococcus sp. mt242]|uniref:hypothetical protein n=1 Tax=unclassified Anaerococcus TaxID=2614126 RepID=UPI001931EEF1|nr:hypothetical protein [Anaerococcus sp. mt242]MBM0046179.1 hypothetical protein [Anaerococcus sp. mt242]